MCTSYDTRRSGKHQRYVIGALVCNAIPMRDVPAAHRDPLAAVTWVHGRSLCGVPSSSSSSRASACSARYATMRSPAARMASRRTRWAWAWAWACVTSCVNVLESVSMTSILRGSLPVTGSGGVLSAIEVQACQPLWVRQNIDFGDQPLGDGQGLYRGQSPVECGYDTGTGIDQGERFPHVTRPERRGLSGDRCRTLHEFRSGAA